MSTIDPSKVKAGDTVTLERCGVTVTGTVESIGVREGETPEFRLADSRAYDTDGYGRWTLTAHQPVPDDAETLRQSLEVAREGRRKEAADWRARVKRMDAEVERLDAEVERLATLAEGQAVKLQGAETARDVLREEMQAMRADLDASRIQVSDLTGRNGALEALVQEQKKGIQARDTWIEDQTADL